MSENLCCPLCKREVEEFTDHHVIPKSRGGIDLVSVCKDCHKQLHALFDNKTLEEELNTIELLLSNEQFCRYIRWVNKRPAGIIHKAKRSRKTKKRGRRG